MYTGKLKDKVIFITGASRGIGAEFAKQFAKDGAKIILGARTETPHPVLKGTIHDVANEIQATGGTVLPLVLDVWKEEMIVEAMAKAASTFGGIDIIINNASILYLTPTLLTPAKRFDAMFSTIARAVFLCSQIAVPYLKKSANPHILNISPPINMQLKWLKDYVAYTICKYGASMCTLSMAEEFKQYGIAVNSLWPQVTIATAAVEVHVPKALPNSRHPKIMADAAYEIITSDSRQLTGNLFTDEKLLRSTGVVDFAQYAINPDMPLYPDMYIDEE